MRLDPAHAGTHRAPIFSSLRRIVAQWPGRTDAGEGNAAQRANRPGIVVDHEAQS